MAFFIVSTLMSLLLCGCKIAKCIICLAMSSQTSLQWPALGVLVLSTLFGLYGDGGLSDQIVTMVRKPQHTVTVWPCVAGNCAKHLGSCLLDADCRKTLGKMSYSLVSNTHHLVSITAIADKKCGDFDKNDDFSS